MELDPLKVFYGQLHPQVSKWELHGWLMRRGVAVQPHNLHIRHSHTGGLTCAFAVFDSEAEAQTAMRVHGVVDAAVTPTWVKATYV